MKPVCFLFLAVFSFSCLTPRFDIPVQTRMVADTLPPLADDREITYVNVYEELPEGSQFLRKVEVGGNRLFSCPACNYELVLAAAGDQARQAGANIVKVIKPRSTWDLGICPRVTFGLFRNDDPAALAAYQERHEAVNASSLPPDANYAVIHFYRPSDPNNGLSVHPVFHQGQRIGRLGNNRKFTYQTTRFGLQRFEIANSPMVLELDVQPGEEYFLTYQPTAGIELEIPGLRLVDNIVGREETKTVREFIPRAARSTR